jgi:FkbM family methyltransferase
MIRRNLDRIRNSAVPLSAAAGLRGVVQSVRVLRHRRSKASRVSPMDPIMVPMKALDGEGIWVRPGTSDLINAAVYYRAGIHRPPPEIAGKDLRTICELGSNMGAGLTALAHEYPNARLLGVEPDPGNAEVAALNLARFGDRVSFVEAGIWDEECELVVDTDVTAGEHGFTVRPRGPGDPPSKSGIRALTIDGLLDEHFPQGEVDYMHVTIEGSEPRVLAAGGAWPQRVRSLRVETHPYFDFDAKQAIDQLEALGYRAWLAPNPPDKWVFAVRA